MKESAWLKWKKGDEMLPLVADRLTPRKWELMACALVRRVLHLLPAQPYQEAVEFAEYIPFTEANNTMTLWPLQLEEAESSARSYARSRQREAMQAFDLDADHSSPDRDDDEGHPAERVFAASNRHAAESVATAVAAAEAAAMAVRHLFAFGGGPLLEVVRQAVLDAQLRAGEVVVLDMVASDLAGNAEHLADHPASPRRNVQFSIADNMVNKAVNEAERRMEEVSEEKQFSENVVLAHLLREQLGNPFRLYRFEPAWRTETVLALASGIEAERAFDRMAILADALEEAGCDERAVLDHLRGSGPHARGCWVLDLILDREPDLFSLPPLVPTPRRMQLGPFTPPPEGLA